ncbi:MAG: hypothetical protein ACYDCC_07430 [Actinomycetota bacterium]
MEIRAANSLEEIAALNAIFAEVWKAPERSCLPNGLLRALTAHSNPLLGAFDPTAIGGVLGWWGLDPDGSRFLFSQKLCVLDSQRRRGTAVALKRAQAEYARSHGVNEIRWTFDPMRAANASLNLNTLRATGIAFYEDLYGPREDAFNAGERTDRMLVSWKLQQPIDIVCAETRRVSVGSNRDQVRDELSSAFADGFRATGFVDNAYVMERAE